MVTTKVKASCHIGPLVIGKWYTWGSKNYAYRIAGVVSRDAYGNPTLWRSDGNPTLWRSDRRISCYREGPWREELTDQKLYPQTDYYEVELIEETDRAVGIAPTEVASIVSDGGATDYYLIPDHATELRHLISARGMSKSRGDIFKACYRLGEKAGVDVLYDLNKMKFFIEDLIEMHGRGERL